MCAPVSYVAKQRGRLASIFYTIEILLLSLPYAAFSGKQEIHKSNVFISYDFDQPWNW